MSVIVPTLEYAPDGNANLVRITWLLANGDTGTPTECGDWADRTVQVTGTFGAGGSVQLEGSNYLTSETPLWAVLTDPQGNTVVKTAAALEVFEESPLLIRPNCTAGDGTTALIVRIVARRNR